jgi:hypothetical protein
MSALRAAALLAAALPLVAACGKSEAPPGDPAAERAAATKRAEEGPYGTQMKALDKAKNLQSDINKKAEDNLEKADQ